jgi:hypothetical protein
MNPVLFEITEHLVGYSWPTHGTHAMRGIEQLMHFLTCVRAFGLPQYPGAARYLSTERSATHVLLPINIESPEDRRFDTILWSKLSVLLLRHPELEGRVYGSISSQETGRQLYESIINTLLNPREFNRRGHDLLAEVSKIEAANFQTMTAFISARNTVISQLKFLDKPVSIEIRYGSFVNAIRGVSELITPCMKFSYLMPTEENYEALEAETINWSEESLTESSLGSEQKKGEMAITPSKPSPTVAVQDLQCRIDDLKESLNSLRGKGAGGERFCEERTKRGERGGRRKRRKSRGDVLTDSTPALTESNLGSEQQQGEMVSIPKPVVEKTAVALLAPQYDDEVVQEEAAGDACKASVEITVVALLAPQHDGKVVQEEAAGDALVVKTPTIPTLCVDVPTLGSDEPALCAEAPAHGTVDNETPTLCVDVPTLGSDEPALCAEDPGHGTVDNETPTLCVDVPTLGSDEPPALGTVDIEAPTLGGDVPTLGANLITVVAQQHDDEVVQEEAAADTRYSALEHQMRVATTHKPLSGNAEEDKAPVEADFVNKKIAPTSKKGHNDDIASPQPSSLSSHQQKQVKMISRERVHMIIIDGTPAPPEGNNLGPDQKQGEMGIMMNEVTMDVPCVEKTPSRVSAVEQSHDPPDAVKTEASAVEEQSRELVSVRQSHQPPDAVGTEVSSADQPHEPVNTVGQAYEPVCVMEPPNAVKIKASAMEQALIITTTTTPPVAATTGLAGTPATSVRSDDALGVGKLGNSESDELHIPREVNVMSQEEQPQEEQPQGEQHQEERVTANADGRAQQERTQEERIAADVDSVVRKEQPQGKPTQAQRELESREKEGHDSPREQTRGEHDQEPQGGDPPGENSMNNAENEDKQDFVVPRLDSKERKGRVHEEQAQEERREEERASGKQAQGEQASGKQAQGEIPQGEQAQGIDKHYTSIVIEFKEQRQSSILGMGDQFLVNGMEHQFPVDGMKHWHMVSNPQCAPDDEDDSSDSSAGSDNDKPPRRMGWECGVMNEGRHQETSCYKSMQQRQDKRSVKRERVLPYSARVRMD